jgi:integrase
VKRAGIPGRLRVHDLRHSYASLALSRGASLAAVSRALGHQRISTTLDMYVHALPSDTGQLSEIMDVVYA